MILKPKKPEPTWLASFIKPNILKGKAYSIQKEAITVKLDQNESPYDWPQAMKERVLADLVQQKWNRYPDGYSTEIQELLAKKLNITPESIFLGPGSNILIANLLLLLTARKETRTLVATPSFPLYAECLRNYEAEHAPWYLTDDFEYDVAKLKSLGPFSLLVLASPNNPVGNVLSKKDLVFLLKEYPQSYFLVDEAYYEFVDESFLDLLGEHANLILVRTFSKSLGAAGVRIGYVLAHESILCELKKITVPYLLNHFCAAVARACLTDDSFLNWTKEVRAGIILEKEKIFKRLAEICPSKGIFVFRSWTNFLLLRCASQEQAENLTRHLVKNDILVRNVSAGPNLTGCLRVTVGNLEENAKSVKKA